MTEKTDAFAGHGGSYLVDPETGERVLLERTKAAVVTPTQPVPAPAETTELE